MNWKDYEIYITKHFQAQFPQASIQHNVKREGLLSKVNRQIDILIEGRVAGFDLKVIIDCKYFNKKVDVKAVESFLSFLQDLKASKGVLITNHGYSNAAYNRATYDSQDIELRIIKFDELEKFQGFIAIPYSMSECAIISSPDGWIVDAAASGNYLAAFYPLGLSQKEAFHNDGFIYLNFNHKDKKCLNLAALLNQQQQNIINHYQSPEIDYINTIEREDCEVTLRVLITKEVNNLVEYTIFLDFPQVIIHLTLLTQNSKSKLYLKKLEWIAQKLIKGNVIFSKEGKPLNINV